MSGKLVFNGYRVLGGEDENVLKKDGGSLKMVDLMLCVFYCNRKVTALS